MLDIHSQNITPCMMRVRNILNPNPISHLRVSFSNSVPVIIITRTRPRLLLRPRVPTDTLYGSRAARVPVRIAISKSDLSNLSFIQGQLCDSAGWGTLTLAQHWPGVMVAVSMCAKYALGCFLDGLLSKSLTDYTVA